MENEKKNKCLVSIVIFFLDIFFFFQKQISYKMQAHELLLFDKFLIFM